MDEIQPEGCREYATSENEMNRRKTAFTAPVISLFVGVWVSSIDFILSVPEIALPGFVAFAAILLISRALTNRLFESSKQTTIIISNDSLVRKTIRSDEEFPTDHIESIRVKRTAKGLIREIKLGLAGAAPFHINGIEQFEELKDDVVETAKGDVPVSEFREPLEFDHPWFYPIFGSLVGVISAFSFRILMRMNEEDLGHLQIAVGVGLMFIGWIFIGKQPVRGRYGNRGRVADLMLGVPMELLGVFLWWSS